jgi:hypothetical protein
LLEVYRVRGLELVAFHNGLEHSRCALASLADVDAEVTRQMLYAMRAGAAFHLDECSSLDEARASSRRLIRAFHLVTEAEKREASR